MKLKKESEYINNESVMKRKKGILILFVWCKGISTFY